MIVQQPKAWLGREASAGRAEENKTRLPFVWLLSTPSAWHYFRYFLPKTLQWEWHAKLADSGTGVTDLSLWFCYNLVQLLWCIAVVIPSSLYEGLMGA